MQSGRSVLGLGAMLVFALAGCGGDEPGPGSEVGKSGGSGGMAGTGGELALPGLGGGGAGAGGAAGAAGSAGTSTGGVSSGGAGGTGQGGKGGDSSSAGKSGGGTGGTKPAGMCKRVAASDADCVEFWEDTKTQAYACDDTSAASALKNMHGGDCASTSGIPGGNYGMCCAP